MPLGTGSGVANAPLSDGEHARLLREWASLKGKSAGKSEGQKDGTGRVAVYR